MKRYCLILVFMMCLVGPGEGAFGAPSGAGSRGATALAPVAGWQAKWDQLVAAGKKEGKVVIYGEVGPIFKSKVTEAFGRKYGIAVESVSGKANEVATKFLTERSNNLSLADVLIVGQTTTLAVVKPQKVLASPRPDLLLPEVLDSKIWPNGVLPFLDRDQLVLRLVAGFVPFVTVNTKLVKEGDITSYADLLDPKWKGKITIYDPTISGQGGAWLNFIMTAFGRAGGEKYLRQLAAQNPVITRDARMHSETVARGKYAIGLGAATQVVQDLMLAGAPISWLHVKEGGFMISGAFVAALPDKPAHPAAAALMLNFLLSREGQQIAGDSIGLPPMRRDLPLSPTLEKGLPKPGEKVYWMDEDVILSEKPYYPIARDIFNIH